LIFKGLLFCGLVTFSYTFGLCNLGISFIHLGYTLQFNLLCQNIIVIVFLIGFFQVSKKICNTYQVAYSIRTCSCNTPPFHNSMQKKRVALFEKVLPLEIIIDLVVISICYVSIISNTL